MRPPSYMRSVDDRNVVMRRIPVFGSDDWRRNMKCQWLIQRITNATNRPLPNISLFRLRLFSCQQVASRYWLGLSFTYRLFQSTRWRLSVKSNYSLRSITIRTCPSAKHPHILTL